MFGVSQQRKEEERKSRHPPALAAGLKAHSATALPQRSCPQLHYPHPLNPLVPPLPLAPRAPLAPRSHADSALPRYPLLARQPRAHARSRRRVGGADRSLRKSRHNSRRQRSRSRRRRPGARASQGCRCDQGRSRGAAVLLRIRSAARRSLSACLQLRANVLCGQYLCCVRCLHCLHCLQPRNKRRRATFGGGVCICERLHTAAQMHALPAHGCGTANRPKRAVSPAAFLRLRSTRSMSILKNASKKAARS